MKDIDFVDISGHLRVLEKRLITNSALEHMVDASDLEETFRMLSQNSDYDFSSLSRFDQGELILKQEMRRIYDLAYSLTEHRKVVDVLICRYDYHNLKVALKAEFFSQRTALPYINLGEMTEEQLEKLPYTPDLPQHLKDAVTRAKEGFENSGNPQDIDIIIDRAMFSHIMAFCTQINEEFITEYFRMAIDFVNIKTLVRARETQRGTAFLADSLIDGGKTPVPFFIENYSRTPTAMVPVFYYHYFGDAMRIGVETYERSGNFSELERQLDNLLVRHTKQVKYIAFGSPILFAYILSKENEIRQIRILLTCKHNGIPPEALKERLRENYA